MGGKSGKGSSGGRNILGRMSPTDQREYNSGYVAGRSGKRRASGYASDSPYEIGYSRGRRNRPKKKR